MARLTLPVASYEIRSTPASSARLVNCYPEKLPEGAPTPFILTRAPGITLRANPGSGPIRGMHAAFGDLFVVSGNELYRVYADGTSLNLGTVTSGAISMAHNDQYIVVVAKPDGFYSDGTTAVAQISDPDFTARGAAFVQFVDNYLLFMEPTSGRFFCSDLGSATSFDALDFATAEAAPDDLVGMVVDHRQVVLLGEETIEIWENTGNSGFPFERAVNGFAEIGCFNGYTVAKMDNSVYWLANDYTVRRLNGATPVRVSTHAVEQFLSTADVGTGIAYSYPQDGHFFYVLCFSTGCWVYDATIDRWHERNSYGYDYFRWQCQAEAHGRQYVGDVLTDAVGYFNPESYDEIGGIQRMLWSYQPVYGENRRALHHRLEIIMETGVGLTTGQGSDPEMMLDVSDDGGKTYRSMPNKGIGEIGRYSDRVVWHKLGSARRRVYRAAVTDPVRVTVFDTALEATGARV